MLTYLRYAPLLRASRLATKQKSINWHDVGLRLKQIGIFGGSFDPPHVGHVALVQAALAEAVVEEVWVVPVGIPVHRELSGHIDAATRLAWVKKTFANEPRVKVLDWEVVRNEPTPTIHTLRRIRSEHPEVMPVLLLGADAFAGMASWVEWPAHTALCRVVAFARRGHALEVPLGWREVSRDEWARSDEPGVVLRIEAELPEVSATEIRQRAEASQSLAGLVPESVCDMVESTYGKRMNQ